MQINYLTKESSLLVYVMLLSVTQLFSYIPYAGNSLWNTFYFILFFIYGIIFLRHRSLLSSKPFSKSINFLVLGLFLSIIPAQFDFNQNIIDSSKAIIILGIGYFFYYYLHSTKLDERQLSRCVIVFALIYTFIEYLQVQGIIEPTFSVWSSKIADGGQFAERFGVIRYQVRGICFLMFAIALLADKAFNYSDKRVLYIVLLSIVTLGIYLYAARKLYYMTIAILACSALFSSKSKKKYNIALIAVALLYIIYNFYADFSQESSALTEAQTESSGDFIRVVSAEYFISSFSDSFLYPFFGSGIAWGGTPLHQELAKLADIGFYQADSGIVGYYSKTGLMGVFSILSIYYFLCKNWSFIDKKYKIYLLCSLIIVFFDFWAIIPEGVLCMSLCLYMCDKNIEKNRFNQESDQISIV